MEIYIIFFYVNIYVKAYILPSYSFCYALYIYIALSITLTSYFWNNKNLVQTNLKFSTKLTNYFYMHIFLFQTLYTAKII
jgi:hypothetical protein